jgi:hypothetical protein
MPPKRHHKSGQFAEAERLYRTYLEATRPMGMLGISSALPARP